MNLPVGGTRYRLLLVYAFSIADPLEKDNDADGRGTKHRYLLPASPVRDGTLVFSTCSFLIQLLPWRFPAYPG